MLTAYAFKGRMRGNKTMCRCPLRNSARKRAGKHGNQFHLKTFRIAGEIRSNHTGVDELDVMFVPSRRREYS